MSTLAERLKASREDRGWSQPELATRTKISQSFIGALETGRQKSSKWLPEIAHTLGIDAYWLKTGIETIIAGDKRINEVVKLMQRTADDGRLVVLDKARDIARDHPRQINENRAA